MIVDILLHLSVRRYMVETYNKNWVKYDQVFFIELNQNSEAITTGFSSEWSKSEKFDLK